MIIQADKKLKEVKYFRINTFKDHRGQIWTFWKKKKKSKSWSKNYHMVQKGTIMVPYGTIMVP